jgi:hypothetical protein
MRDTSLNRFWFSVKDIMGGPVKSGLTAVIRNADNTVATIYADENKAAKTNPTSPDTRSGIVNFYSFASSLTVELYDANGNRSVVAAVTPTVHQIVFDVSRQSACLVGANIVLGDELVDTAATFTDFPHAVSLYGPSLQAGDVIRIRGQVRIADFNSGDKLDVRVLVGTETVLQTGDLTPAADGDLLNFEMDVTVDVAGASGKLSGFGRYMTKLNTTVANQPVYKAQAAEDLSGTVVIKVQGDWSATHDDNEAYLTHFNAEVLPRR